MRVIDYPYGYHLLKTELHTTNIIVKEPQHIAIAGNIGVGKTTLVQKLAQHYSWKPHLEAVDDNPYLSDFYQDMAKWSFPLQIYFLNSRFNQVVEIQNSPISIIQDRTIYEDAFIFAKNLNESGLLESRDYQTYLALFKSMSNMIKAPDLMIYLRAGVPTLVDQIAKRGRDYEVSISIKYLENLNRNYEEWISEYREGPLLILETDDLDYVNRPEDFDFVLQKIEEELIVKS